MPSLKVEGNAIHINLSTMDKIWSIHGSLTIPLSHIKNASVEDEDGWHLMWRKLAGAGLPGVKMAGTFFAPGGLAFLDFSSGRSCVVLETQHERYKTVIVQVDGDPDALVADINRRIGIT